MDPLGACVRVVSSGDRGGVATLNGCVTRRWGRERGVRARRGVRERHRHAQRARNIIEASENEAAGEYIPGG